MDNLKMIYAQMKITKDLLKSYEKAKKSDEKDAANKIADILIHISQELSTNMQALK